MKRFLICLFVFSVLMKLIAAYYAGNKFDPTLWEYDTIAMNIVNGQGFSYKWDIAPIAKFNINFRSYLEPFFVILCAAVYYLTKHSILTMLVLQILYASFIPIAVYYIARSMYDMKTAVISSVFSVFVPGILLYSATKLHYMPLYALFICLLVLFTFYFAERPSFKNQIFLGAILGMPF